MASIASALRNVPDAGDCLCGTRFGESQAQSEGPAGGQIVGGIVNEVGGLAELPAQLPQLVLRTAEVSGQA
jgi:hypothetical protein